MNKYDLNNIFKKFEKNEKTPHRTTIRNNVLKYKMIPYQCLGCGNKGNWNGTPLILELHHMNGNKFDNRLSNLAFMCPNCHVSYHVKMRKEQVK